MSQPTAREESLFLKAVELPAAQRDSFLLRECANDPALRRRLEDLLKAASSTGNLLAPAEQETHAGGPAPGPGGTIRLNSPTEKPGDHIGPYKLREQVGEGGCGVVYVAEQEKPIRRRVALKVIKLGMDTKSVIARFEAERQALAMMDHPNIAKVLDAGTTDAGRPYFVMELVRGIKITDYCDQAHLGTKERLDLFIKVCHAIQHAHQKGIIHRDIKPSNILVTLHDGVPVPKVIDFGIAKATEGRLTDNTGYTQLHQFIGTPAYMSPEQAEMSGLDIDTRSDIYSLGVLLYELLAGSTPFDPKELMESGLDAMRRTIREQEPPRPSTRLATLGANELTTTAKRRSADTAKLLHQLKGDLDWIVMKCLEKDRQRRYDTANGLAADITRHLTNEPVTARPPSAAYKFQKAYRRNRLAFTAATCVLASLVVALVFIWTAAQREGHARVRESIQRNLAEQQRTEAQAAQKVAESERQRADAERQRAEAGERHTQQLLYAANMNRAQQAWEQNNVGVIREMLAETANYPNRGFEWYYWQRQAHLEIRTLRGHTEGINSLAISPDGRRIVTGSSDETVRVWDAASGKELFTLPQPSGQFQVTVAYSPDGQRILTGGYFSAQVWDAASGKELFTLTGQNGLSLRAVFSPDGQRILIASPGRENTARLWDAASGRELLTLPRHSGVVLSVAFSPDGQRIVTGSFDNTARISDAASGKELFTFTHSGPVRSVAYSPDGRRIVTGSDDGAPKIWDAASGKELFTLAGKSGPVPSGGFSPDGQRIVTGSLEGTATVWDTASGKELFVLRGHTGPVLPAGYSPDGQRIVTRGSLDSTTTVWDAASGKELLTLRGHSSLVAAVAFSPDGRRIVTGGRDGTAKIWDVPSGKEGLKPEWLGSAIDFSSDGQRFAARSRDGTVKVWETASGKELLTLNALTGVVYSVAFSPDGKRIVTDGGRTSITSTKVWDAASGRELFTLPMRGSSPLQSLVFSPDGRRIVMESVLPTETGGWRFEYAAKILDAANGKELLTLKGHRNRVGTMAFSPDSQRIVTGSYDYTAKVWDTASGGELLTLKGHRDSVTFVTFSPDGQRIVTGSRDNTARVWDTASGKELLTLTGHRSSVGVVTFSPDGQRIVTGSRDNTAKVWDTASGKELFTLAGHGDSVMSVAFSPDGQRILTSGILSTGTKVWDAASGKELLTLKGRSWVVPGAVSPDRQRIVTDSLDGIEVLEVATREQVGAWQQEEAAWQRKLDEFHQAEGKRRDIAYLSRQASEHSRAGRHAEAISLYEEALAAQKGALGRSDRATVAAMNGLAWLLATVPDANYRDGKAAVGLAEQSVTATNRKNASYLDTLAAAYAETGEFTKAVILQQESIALLSNDVERKDYTARLRLYESNQPYRKP